MTKFFYCRPICKINDWKKAVGQGKFKKGYSAYELAYAWLPNQDIPKDILSAIESKFKNVELNRADIEYHVSFKGRGRTSCTDIMVDVKTNKGGLIIAVEGKCEEPFGKKISEWLRNGNRGNREERIENICSTLELKLECVCDLRYQLLHRAASAISTAIERKYENAMILVHSFSQKNSHFNDFQEFGNKLGINVKCHNKLYPVKKIQGINFYMLWFNSNCLRK